MIGRFQADVSTDRPDPDLQNRKSDQVALVRPRLVCICRQTVPAVMLEILYFSPSHALANLGQGPNGIGILETRSPDRSDLLSNYGRVAREWAIDHEACE